MSIALGLSLAFLLLCEVTLGIVASRVWRGDTKAAQRLELGFALVPARSDVKRGMVRGVVPLMLALVFTMVAVVSSVIAMTTRSGGKQVHAMGIHGGLLARRDARRLCAAPVHHLLQ